MNYTEKYHLPQWVETDRIMMEDFNQMCADIEAGLSEAKSTADTARMEAAEAAVLPYVVGSYTGNDAETRDFDLGFRPSFLVICSTAQRTGDSLGCGRGVMMTGPFIDIYPITLTDTGFRTAKDTHQPYPDPNNSDCRYDYIAFR